MVIGAIVFGYVVMLLVWCDDPILPVFALVYVAYASIWICTFYILERFQLSLEDDNNWLVEWLAYVIVFGIVSSLCLMPSFYLFVRLFGSGGFVY